MAGLEGHKEAAALAIPPMIARRAWTRPHAIDIIRSMLSRRSLLALPAAAAIPLMTKETKNPRQIPAMRKRHTIGAIAGIVILAGVIYIYRGRLEASKKGLPWGVHMERHVEEAFEAGVILPLARMPAIHAPMFSYIRANNKLYNHPKGEFPFFEVVSNRPNLIAFVIDGAGGHATIVVINRQTGDVVEINTDGTDVLGLGLDAGSLTSPENDEVEFLAGSNRIAWPHRQDGRTKTWMIDLELKQISKGTAAAGQ